MTKYKNRWGSEERAEYDALVDEAWKSGKSTTERGQAFLDGLRDASQAHRPWADEVMLDAITRGSASIIKADYKRANQVAVMSDGRSLEKSRVIGVRRRTASGAQSFEQTLFDFVNAEELREKRKEYMANALAYSDNIAVVDKLLDLCERGHSDIPANAAANLHTTVDAWLAA